MGLLAALIARILVGANSRPAPRRPGETVTLEMSVWRMPSGDDLYTKVYIEEFERENPGI